ncbi:long-chain-fatty-acid--CoA ligase [Mesorhizobium sp. YIM 152430]|uniref:long-chain-fatty-acid--CoA ligase n=1 Tax=Mesorhizobium sp. YIM 152430 TaxID=3031761 RepID=UPI0023DBCDA7|nr:long-chain-fatty-acid--CoA ligase [Mesorhizobium sp. YIM 152430]MDF1599079.1 long-chain-fatty-acid--CoA ligase [Mesorhizobium sp. YIM 152430]
MNPAAKKPAAKKAPAAKTSASAKPKAPVKTAAKKPAANVAATAVDAPASAPSKAAAAKASTPKTTAKTASKKTADKVEKPAATKAKTSAAKSKPATSTDPKAEPAVAPAASARQTAAKADKPWLANYPKDVPGEIGPLEYQSLGDLMVESCRKYGSKPAFTCMGKSITFTELEKQSAAFAAYLQGKGLSKGARVAIMMPNVLQYPIAMMAVLRAGYTVVNVNPLYTPRELEHQLNDSGAEAIVILENFASTLQQVIGRTKVKHVVVAAMGDRLGLKGIVVNLVVRRVKKMVPAWSLPGHVPFNDALKEGAKKTFRKIDVGHDDVAFLQYTGGTTGVSKGATLLHRNVLANVAQNALWVEAAYSKKPKPKDVVYICALPLYHIYALTVNALMGMQQGAQNILIPNPRDIPAFVKELQKTPFHVFPGLNTLFNALLNNADFQKLDFKPLILTFGGGMAVQKPVADRWKKLTGIVIAEGYGLSETAPVATANRFDADEFSGTIGMPIPSTEIVIRDEDGKDVPTGEVGEICIRGPQVMAGYWNRADETKKVMTDDGFFKSGDMGFIDARGFVKIVDRKKDMILVSGFNVYPNELEEVVAEHPGVLEVAAVGVPDEHSGEVPKLFVVKKDEKLTEQEIIDFTRDKLTGYKRPRHVEFRKELPKTNVGKILRRELR